jgi:hypothetical protein
MRSADVGIGDAMPYVAMGASGGKATLPPDLTFEDGEYVVKQGQIARLMGLLVQHAYLILTNRHLVFMPIAAPFVPMASVRHDIPLSAVDRVSRGSFLARLSPGMFLGCPEMRLHLKDGDLIRFRSRSATAWIEAIEAQGL